MEQSSLFPKSESDIEKEYKQKIFLTTLKEGKTPIRKTLFRNIIYLSGLSKNLGNIITLTRSGFYPTYDKHYRLAFWCAVKPISENERFINNLKRYLSNQFRIELCSFYISNNCMDVYYKSDSIRWDLIEC